MESGLATLAERRDVSSPEVCLGFDLGAPSLDMAVPGVNSIISAGAHQHGQWLRHLPGARLWTAERLLDTISCREAGPGATALAAVAVPGWFGTLDRAAMREVLAAEHHSVALITTTLAAAVAWMHTRDPGSGQPAVLCLDPDVGVSVSVVAFGPHGPREVAVASIPPRPGLEGAGPARADLIVGLVGHVLRLARAAGVTRVDTAILLVSSTDDPLVEQLPRVLAAVTPPDELVPQPVTLQRRDVVARGALLAQVAGGRGDVPSCGRTVPHRLGVIVETDRGLEVMTLVAAGQEVPLVVERCFAADGGGPIRLDLVEARRPGATDDPADWEPVASVTWIDAHPASDGAAPDLVAVEFHLSLDADAVAALGPAHRWQAVVGHGAVELLSSPTGSLADLVGVEAERVTPSAPAATDAIEAPPAVPTVSDQRDLGSAGRSLAWPDATSRSDPPRTGWPPPTPEPAAVALVELSEPGTGPALVDDVEHRARLEAASFIRELGDGLRSMSADAGPALDDEALEEIARAEIGAPGLAAALHDLERRLSRHFGITLGVRSIPALLDCDDDADLQILRAGAARLDAALDGQPDDELTESVRAAVRAARRTFGDESLPRFVGGSPTAIAADAVAVVDHLRLMVGDVQPVERRRLLLDARLRGLSARSTEALVERLVGPVADEAMGERSAPPLARDAVARLGLGHRGWSLEMHADPSEAASAEIRAGIAQIRVLLLEPCGG